MLKRAIISAALLIVALVVVDRASLFFPPCLHNYSEETDEGRANHDYCAAREGIIISAVKVLYSLKPEVWTALGTIAIAAFTLTLWLTTNRQASLTRDSIDLSNKEFVATNRAFVSLERFDLDARKGGRLAYLRFDFIPVWRNSGTTPTDHLEVVVNFRKHVGNLPADFDYPYEDEASPLFIGPQSAERGAKREVPPAMINEVIADAAYSRPNNRQLFIWGRAKYQTILGDGEIYICDWCYQVEFISLNADDLSYSFVQWGNYNRSYKEENA